MKKRFLSLLLVVSMLLSLLNTFTFVASAATGNGSCGETATWNLDDAGVLTISGTGIITDDSYKDSYQSSIKKLVIEEGITGICDYAFSDCKYLTEVSLPEGLETIGKRAFDCCVALTTVHIPESVTSIGEYPFIDCVKLTAITVDEDNENYMSEDGVLYNKDQTVLLRYPSGKDELTFSVPDGVTTIGKQAFGSATVDTNTWMAANGYCKLTSIELPNSVNTIESAAFSLCRDLKTVNLPDELSTIESGIFRGCFSIEKIVIPQGVTSIGQSAFFNCKSMKSIYIPNSVTEIGVEALRLYDSVPSMSILYDGMESEWENITIGTLNSMITEENLKFLHVSTMNSPCIKAGIDEYWLGYDGIGFYSDSDRTMEIDELYEHNLVTDAAKDPTCTESGLTQGSHCTVCNEVLITQDTIPALGHTDSDSDGYCDICSSLAQNVVDSGTCGTNATWVLGEDGTLYINGTGSVADNTGFINYKSTSNNSKNAVIKSIVISEGITDLCASAFYNCNSVKSVTIPSTLKTIGGNAFYGCRTITGVYISDISAWCNISFADYNASPLYLAKKLYLNNELVTDLSIPEGVTTIKNYAFYNCTSIQSVRIPASIENIGFYAFSQCSNLSNVYVSDLSEWCNISFDRAGANPLSVAQTLYVDNNAVTEVIIPDGVTTIKSYAFCGFKNLTSVTLPNSVTKINEYAFSECTKLTEANLSSALKTIGDYAFNNCSSITNIEMPDTVTSIGQYAFCNCTKLSSVDLSEGLTQIGQHAFHTCRELKSIVIPNSVTSVSANAFYGCNALAEVTLSDKMTSIPIEMFYGCNKLTNIKIPDSITSIGSKAFYNCTTLNSIYIGTGITRIGEEAFYGCAALRGVYITDASKWAKIDFGYKYLGTTSNGLGGYVPYYDYTGNPLYLAKKLYLNNAPITDLLILGDVTKIEDYAFYGCTNLKKIMIPSSVTNIGSKAFAGCSGIQKVYFQGTKEEQGNLYAFDSSVDVVYGYAAVTGVELNVSSISLNPNETAQLIANLIPSTATYQNVTWESSDTNIATVSSTGLVKAIAKGTATITVTTTEGGFKDTCEVTVLQPVQSVSLNKTTTTINIGNSETLIATVTPDNASNKDVTWKSSNTTIATVENGIVTAKKKGTTTITVTTVDGSKTATCAVSVLQPVTDVSLNKSTTTLSVGSTEKLIATISPTTASNKNVIWSSSNSNIASVSTDGTVTANAAGTAVITAKTEDGSKTDTCTVVVNKATKPAAPVITGVQVDLESADDENETVYIELAGTNDEFAQQYEVLWGTTNNPTTETTVLGFTGYDLKIDLDISSGTTYYFKVRRCHGSTKSDWSNIYSYKYKKIDAPTLSSAYLEYDDFYLNGVQHINDKPCLIVTWNAVSNASRYYVEVKGEANNGSFTRWNTATGTSTDFHNPGFIPGDKLKITVQAYSSTYNATSAYSEVYELTLPTTVISNIKLTTTDSWSATECKKLSLAAGEKAWLYDQLSPYNAINPTLKWTSSNTDVATVTDYGYVTALSEGKTTLTCYAAYGEAYTTCEITVTPGEGTTNPDDPEEVTGVNVSKKCGDNATWTLDETGLLKITGTGAVWNRNNYSVYNYLKYIKRVEIDEGITELGEFTFSDCVNLSEIVLPESLENIKSSVFSRCPITNITIPKNVAYIEGNPFYLCDNLTQINVSTENTNYFSVDGVLVESASLALVAYPKGKNASEYSIFNGIERIGKQAFSNNTHLTSVVIPDTVKSIENSAFSGCTNLEIVVIPNSVTSISPSAFSSSGLTSVVLPSDLEVVSGSAFSSCKNLDYVVIPKSVLYIENNAFGWCPNITHVNFEGTSDEWKKIVIGSNNDSLVSATINYESTHVHTGGTSTCSKKAVCSTCGEEYGAYSHNLETVPYKASSCTVPGWSSYEKCLDCDYSTYKESALKNHTIGKYGSVEASCDNTGNITYYMCSDCNTYFSDITGSNEISPEDIFIEPLGHSYSNGKCIRCSKVEPNKCGNDLTWTINADGVLTISGTGEMWSYYSWTPSEIKEVIINFGATSIGSKAFYNCTNLTKVSLPNSITNVGELAFYNCSFSDIVVPDSVTTIGKNAFRACSELTSMTIPFVGGSPTSNTTMGYLFNNSTTNLKTITVTNAETLSSQAFRYCSNVETIKLPNTLTSIDSSTFSYCTKLEDVYYDGTLAEWNAIYSGTLSAELHILGTEVESISLNKTSSLIYEGEKETLVATILPEVGTNKRVVWTSSNEEVVSVENGIITGITVGNATITATTVNGKTATCAVTVDKKVTSIFLNKTTLSLDVGGTDTLVATVLPSGVTNKSVVWTSSNERVATVNNGVITALTGGKTTITATTVNGNKTASCLVTVRGDVSATISGSVKSFGDETANITIELADESGVLDTETVVGNNQTYSFDGLASGTYTVRVSKSKHCTREYEVIVSDSDVTLNVEIWLYGDVNADGTVNHIDVLQINRNIASQTSVFDAGTDELKAYRFNVANVTAINGSDTELNHIDVLQINRKIANLTSIFDSLQ